MPEERKRRMRLGEILVDADVLTPAQLEDALAAQAADHNRQRLGRTILELGLCTEADIARALARQLRLETVDLAEIGPEPSALSRVPRKLAERHHALPLRIEPGDLLIVAMSDPTNVVALDDLKLTSGLRAVRPLVATETSISEALKRAYGSDQTALDMVDQLDDSDIVAVDREDDDLSNLTDTVDDQPIIRLANAILSDAVRSRTSDVHVEPERGAVRVRYRIDGMLRETMRVPRHIGPALTSRIKIMSKLDIAERRRPQDGRAMIRVEGQEVDLRVSTMPTMFGETIVLRLLRKGAERLTIDDLGMAADYRERFETALARPQGLVVITGPTGSGKTTTLYAGLTDLADPVRNIITLEDPIEYQLEGVNQTQVNPKIDLTFARGLRTVLRQDPDVVMVGEIRDGETAELAMEASFTGHLVLSTLHTNDAPSSIVRLHDLGVERFLIASSLILVVAQRLGRVVCPHCAEPTTADPKTLHHLGLTVENLEGAELTEGRGCQMCEHTGFLGRIGFYEMLRITPKMRELITEGANEIAIATLARREGMRTLREDGLAKAYAGLTTLEEVLRVTPEESLDVDRRSIDPSVLEGVNPAPAEQPLRTDDAAADDERHPATTTASGNGHRALDDDVHRATVMVVDDTGPDRDRLTQLLGQDWSVVTADNGSAALEAHTLHRPDAIVLERQLNDVSGIELTRRIRAADPDRRVPILMITGSGDADAEVEGLLAGVDDYLARPLDEDTVRSRVQAALKRT